MLWDFRCRLPENSENSAKWRLQEQFWPEEKGEISSCRWKRLLGAGECSRRQGTRNSANARPWRAAGATSCYRTRPWLRHSRLVNWELAGGPKTANFGEIPNLGQGSERTSGRGGVGQGSNDVSKQISLLQGQGQVPGEVPSARAQHRGKQRLLAEAISPLGKVEISLISQFFEIPRIRFGASSARSHPTIMAPAAVDVHRRSASFLPLLLLANSPGSSWKSASTGASSGYFGPKV